MLTPAQLVNIKIGEEGWSDHEVMAEDRDADSVGSLSVRGADRGADAVHKCTSGFGRTEARSSGAGPGVSKG